MNTLCTTATRYTLVLAMCALSACASVGNTLNPFYEDPAPNALLGQANDHALSGGAGGTDDRARAAFEAMGQYRGALPKEPAYPVIQPAVVRVMWIPDHLNKSGDLVPAHYYYLKVLRDRWAVEDAFELEAQLHGDRGAAAPTNTNIPYVVDDRR